MVLYNNMLQSLFRSQIQTIGVTVLAIMVMFMVLFRSLRISLIALFPNLAASLVVLGAMGLLGIPLDMMTITIVAISIGIAVDNTIHYLWRFRRELDVDQDYSGAIIRTHRTVGRACVFNSVVLVGGFWVLCLSKFIPTVYFGMMIGLTMVGALAGDIILLPMLLTLLRPVRVKRFEV